MRPTIASLLAPDATAELAEATKGAYHLLRTRTPGDLARNSADAEIIVYDPRILGEGSEALATYLAHTPARVVCRMPLEPTANAWLVAFATRRPTVEVYLGGRERDARNTWLGRIDGAPANGTVAMMGAAARLELSDAAMIFVCATIMRGERQCSVHKLAATFGHDSERWAQTEAVILKLPAPHWLLAAALCLHTFARLEAGLELKAVSVLAGFRSSDPLVKRISRISGRSPTEWMNAGGLESALGWYEAGLREHRTSATPLGLT